MQLSCQEQYCAQTVACGPAWMAAQHTTKATKDVHPTGMCCFSGAPGLQGKCGCSNSPHQRLNSPQCFPPGETRRQQRPQGPGKSPLCLLLTSLVDGGRKGKTWAHRGLRHPATTSPAIFVSLSLTHKPSTGSQCSAASHCVYESTVQYLMTWAEVISPLQLDCLAGVSHLPALGPAGCRVTNGKDALW